MVHRTGDDAADELTPRVMRRIPIADGGPIAGCAMEATQKEHVVHAPVEKA